MEHTVTICTPTYNRRKYIENLIQNVMNQDYPAKLIQWVVVDDGEDSVEDLIQKAQEKMKEIEIVYIKLSEKVSLEKNAIFFTNILIPFWYIWTTMITIHPHEFHMR